jgi:hypothetical protein
MNERERAHVEFRDRYTGLVDTLAPSAPERSARS